MIRFVERSTRVIGAIVYRHHALLRKEMLLDFVMAVANNPECALDKSESRSARSDWTHFRTRIGTSLRRNLTTS